MDEAKVLEIIKEIAVLKQSIKDSKEIAMAEAKAAAKARNEKAKAQIKILNRDLAAERAKL